MKTILLMFCFLVTVAIAEGGSMSPADCDLKYGKPEYIWGREDFERGWSPARPLPTPWYKEVRCYNFNNGTAIYACFYEDQGNLVCVAVFQGACKSTPIKMRQN